MPEWSLCFSSNDNRAARRLDSVEPGRSNAARYVGDDVKARMINKLDPLVAEQEFFGALISGKIEVLDDLLVDDFILVDVMRGAEISKAELLAAVASRQVKFEAMEPSGARVRKFGATAIVNGRTEMRGRAGDAAFAVRSRYTHVYVEEQGRMRLASAQGTQIVET